MISHLCNAHRWATGAELGLLQGRTFKTLLTDCPRLQMLIGVDPFVYMPDAPGGKVYSKVDHAANEKLVDEIALKFSTRCVVLKATTCEASKHVTDGSLDFIYIDADHSYEGVSADIRDWWVKLKVGGWMLGDDYADDFPGVVKAVAERWSPAVPIGTKTTGPQERVHLIAARTWAMQKEG